MAEKGGGSVVIVSSIGGLRGSAQLGAYGISKAADMQLTRSLAVEWGPKNVRINCVAPGLVKTDFARALWEDPETAEAHRIDRSPLRRIGEPHEIGGVVAFLASNASTFMTGTVIVADGGVTIGGDVVLPSPACGGGCRAKRGGWGSLRRFDPSFSCARRA